MEIAYSDRDGKPIQVPSIVAYIDFLGYSEHIIDNSGNTELVRLRSALDEAYKYLKDKTNNRKIYFRTFTDNLIIAIPQPAYETGDSVVWIDTMVESVSFIQAQLANDGYLIRGAISFGNFYLDNDIVFGKALIEAYDAENKQSIFPRVILCESTIKAIRKNSGQTVKGLLKDSDNLIFVDYLDETVMIAFPHVRPFTDEFLRGHQTCILNNLNKFSANPHVLAKYEWAANYHNFFCDKYSDAIEADLRIPAERLIHPIAPWTIPNFIQPL